MRLHIIIIDCTHNEVFLLFCFCIIKTSAFLFIAGLYAVNTHLLNIRSSFLSIPQIVQKEEFHDSIIR